MKFDKIDLTVEKLESVEIFSYDGYILGFRDYHQSNSVSFYPMVFNSERKNILEVYFDFMKAFHVCGDDNRDFHYRFCLDYHDNEHDHFRTSAFIYTPDLISNCNSYIESEGSFKLGGDISSLMIQFLFLDKNFTYSYSYNGFSFYDTSITRSLCLDEDNYIKITTNSSNKYSFIFNSTTEEMDDVVSIFKHFFEMLDKNLNRK